MNKYHEGNQVRVTAQFKDELTKQLVDPTTVAVTVLDPEKASDTLSYGTDVEVVKDSTGVYHYDVDTSGKVGNWTVHWASTGAGQAKEHVTFATFA